LGLQLSPIWPPVKGFLQAITHFNQEAIKSIVKGVLVFITETWMAKMFNLPKNRHNKLPSKPTKEKEKEKEAIIYRKIISLEVLVNREGWKVSLFKGMYAVKLLALIQVI